MLGFDLDEIRGRTYLGVPMMQSWGDLHFYECVLNHHPELSNIVELGTAEGGLALFLGAQSAQRGLGFLSIDNTQPPRTIPGFMLLDIFAETSKLRQLLKQHSPLLLVCDNGDKPREVGELSPSLCPGDLLAVHDWNREIFQADIPDCLDTLYEPLSISYESSTRLFMKNTRP